MNVNKTKIKLSAECTNKTNTYTVLHSNSFRYCGSHAFPVPLNQNVTFPSTIQDREEVKKEKSEMAETMDQGNHGGVNVSRGN